MSGDGNEGGGRLYPPAVCCPKCGSRPALRVTSALIAALHGSPPGERVGSYKCQRRACGVIYDLTAAAYQRAG